MVMIRDQAFDDWVLLPENADRLFELVHGEIMEKMPSNAYASEIANLISFYIRLWMREFNIFAHVTDGQGGYMVNGERYAPDVAYISKARQPKLARQGYNPAPPELAVEVEFPTSVESERRLRLKLMNYLAVGTVVWVVYPEMREVEIYTPGQPVQVLRGGAVIDGGSVLPGFQLPLNTIFEDEAAE
jgi:Uma2 family endonuclease